MQGSALLSEPVRLALECAFDHSAEQGALMPLRKRERRTRFRRPSRRAACVEISALDPPVQCVIWDFSDTGARLAIARRSEDLPSKFILLIKDGGVRRACQV